MIPYDIDKYLKWDICEKFTWAATSANTPATTTMKKVSNNENERAF